MVIFILFHSHFNLCLTSINIFLVGAGTFTLTLALYDSFFLHLVFGFLCVCAFLWPGIYIIKFINIIGSMLLALLILCRFRLHMSGEMKCLPNTEFTFWYVNGSTSCLPADNICMPAMCGLVCLLIIYVWDTPICIYLPGGVSVCVCTCTHVCRSFNQFTSSR